MKKKIILICALILCFGLGIIIGLKLNNSKKEDNSKRINNNTNINTSEYTKKIEELEKKLEESEKKEKLEQTREEYNQKKAEQENQKIKKFKEFLENADSKDSKYKENIEEVLGNFFQYAFNGMPYCGEISRDIEYINDETILNGSYSGGYVKSNTLKSVDEVESFFKKFLSDNYFDSNKKKYYIEKDNELYCYNVGKAGLVYEPNGSKFKIVSSKENKIEVYCTVKVYQLNELTQVEGLATLIKENNNWVVDEYMEFR